jgi:cytochrome c peroxidase
MELGGGKFKVPALWAVSKTAPYLRDGRTADLAGVVKTMWEAQAKKAGKPSSPTPALVNDLVAYLNAL